MAPARKLSETDPTVERILFEELADNGQAVAIFNAQDELHYANQRYTQLFGIDDRARRNFADIMRHCHRARSGLLIAADDIEAWLADVQTRRRCVGRRNFEADFTDGRWIWVTESHRGDGWTCFMGVDITDLKTNEKSLRHARDNALLAANTDPLTGCANRRHITTELEHLLAHAQRPWCVAMLDLDHFKRINDGFGHQAGDRVLCHFSERTKSLLRPGDSFGRIGGEEFLILLPGLALEAAAAVVERLRCGLKDSHGQLGEAGLVYTFSAGVALARADDSCDSLLARADAALYAAKDDGRDCCKVQA